MWFRNVTLLPAIAIFPLLITSAMALASKLAYEVKMDKISVYGSQIPNSLEYEEHSSITISCAYSYLKPYSCATKEPYKWTISFYVDGKKMETKKGIWPAKSSAIGMKNGQSSCMAKFMTSFKWKSVAGPHVMRCVLNENHKISGDVSNNNRLDQKIMIRKLSSIAQKKKPSAAKKLDKPEESIVGHSHLVIKSGSKKKNK